MTYLATLQRLQRHDLSHFRPFRVGADVAGWVGQDLARLLADWPDVFAVSDEEVALRDALTEFDTRSQAVDEVVQALHARGAIPVPTGEPFPVLRAWGDEPLFKMDRAAISRFGVRAFGIHLNGFVRTDAGLEMWIAKRSQRVRTEPGKLDHLMAGGQPYGLTLEQNLVKECAEEASIPAEVALRAVPTGSVSYRMETQDGLRSDTLFTYDLELQADFEPVANDGEVAWFQRWPIERVLAKVRGEPRSFKFNVPHVLIDFFLRHGVLGPKEPDRDDIEAALHG